LPWVLLGLRAAPKEDIAISSAEMVYGTVVSLPSQLQMPGERPVSEFMKVLKEIVPPPT
jgi:hypothetical protein